MTSILIFTFVVLLWFTFKQNETTPQRRLKRRKEYKKLYQQWGKDHSHVWTDGGPKEVTPSGIFPELQWRLLQLWYPKSNVDNGLTPDDGITDVFGPWSDLKEWLAPLWLRSIDKRVAKKLHEIA